jgi:hypothetical protein
MALHLEPHAAILERFPWIALSAVGIALTWLRGWSPASALGIAIVAQVFCYASYIDLSPHGLWRYGNIHYYAWAYPYLALFAFTAVSTVAAGKQVRTFAAVAAVVAVLASVSFARRDVRASISVRDVGNGTHAVDVVFPQRERVTSIDLGDWSGPYDQTDHFHVTADGKALSRVNDFRLLPAKSGLRLLMLHRLYPSRIGIVAEPMFHAGESDQVMAADYRLTLRIPRWPWQALKGLWSPAPWF